MKKKQKRNLDLLLRQINADPNNAYNLFQIARTYLALNDLENAEVQIAKAINLSNNDDSVKPQALNYGALIAYKNNNKELAKQRAALSLSLQSNQGFANYIIGECNYDNHLHVKALENYNAMLNAYQNEDLKANIIGDYRLPTSQIYFRIGRSNLAIGNSKDAKKYFKEGLEYNETDINCLVGLADILNKETDFENALIYLRKAKQAAPQRKEIDSFINVVLNSIENTKTSAKNHKENSSVRVKQPLITLSMIVKNEEKMLRGCLESAEKIVDEIVIVDTGSTDRTIEIAKEFGAKVYQFDWINDFAAARNESLRHSNGKWVLYLDADERISQFEVNKFRKSLGELPENSGGLICTIESPH
ncbi:MAG: glycosyltransferase, partial [Candidatus Kapaibacterium sp.]